MTTAAPKRRDHLQIGDRIILNRRTVLGSLMDTHGQVALIRDGDLDAETVARIFKVLPDVGASVDVLWVEVGDEAPPPALDPDRDIRALNSRRSGAPPLALPATTEPYHSCATCGKPVRAHIRNGDGSHT